MPHIPTAPVGVREGTDMDKVRLEVEELPELETQVGISGSVKQQEVGGAICLTLGAGIAIYLARPF